MMSQLSNFWLALLAVLLLQGSYSVHALEPGPEPEQESPVRGPNILLAIADDAGHMGREVPWVDTPSFDRVAAAGVRFGNAYTPNAKCAPSRASLLTARNSWQLKEAANHMNNFPAEFKTYPEALRDLGYATGYTGKGWGPGNAGEIDGQPRELVGPSWRKITQERPTRAMSKVDYASNFIAFFESKPKAQPFHFWYGAHEPHRRYIFGSSLAAGKKLSDIDAVPGYFPDNETVRTDLLDYALEIEHFDSHLGRILDYLEAQGELDNTLVIVTSDHGMPFPRAKSDEYEASNHVPLAIMWGKNITNPGRVIEDYVSFIDVAPTLFDVAGFSWDETGMQSSPGTSLVDFFDGRTPAPRRDFVLIGKERHDVGRPGDYGYPIRGIVKDGWLYLRNYRPDLWPAGNPETGYPTVDASPTKTEILRARHSSETKHFWDWSFGKRPDEELFNITTDPDCLDNLAANAEYAAVKEGLRNTMETELRAQADPRMFGEGDIFHSYPITLEPVRNYYERSVVQGEYLVPIWINPSDIETDLMQDEP
ncbi:MAG: sulfatase [Halieaceae bacterium]|nr:sulfatase [Halieaceae bacterium]